jgi:hypothetical protein
MKDSIERLGLDRKSGLIRSDMCDTIVFPAPR